MARQASPALTPAAYRLLGDQRFLRYDWAKFLSLLAQNALIYGLFIDVINAQESSLATSVFVLASVIPSILLSVPGGLFSDFLPNKFALLSTMVVRLAIVFLFFDAGGDIATVLLLTFLVWAVYQFYSPAENAAVIAIVPRERFAAASSLLQAISLAAQLVGAGIVAPLAIEFLNADGLYVIVFVLLLVSTVLMALVPNLSAEQEREAKRLSIWRAFPVGYRTIARDQRLMSITIMRILLDTGMMAFIVCAPVFIEDTLDTGAANAIYIAIPGALGIALGLLLAPLILSLAPARLVVLIGSAIFSALLLVLPFIDSIAPDLTRSLGPFRSLQDALNLSNAIVATMILLPLGGFAVSLVEVGARTEVYRRSPVSRISQVFATQAAMGSVAALLPTFFVGVMLDLLPVRVVLVAIGVVLPACAVLAWSRGLGSRRPAPQAKPS
jgi:MFS family permease